MKEILKKLSFNAVGIKKSAAIIRSNDNYYEAVSIRNSCFRDSISAIKGAIGKMVLNGDNYISEIHIYNDTFLPHDLIYQFSDDKTKIYFY